MLICNIIVRKHIQSVSLIKGSWYCCKTSPCLEFFYQLAKYRALFRVVNYNYLYRFSWSILMYWVYFFYCKYRYFFGSRIILSFCNYFHVLLNVQIPVWYLIRCTIHKRPGKDYYWAVFFSLDTEQFSVLKDCAAFFRVLKQETISSFILVLSKCVSTFH